MPLLETLVDSGATSILLEFIIPCEIVALATTSTNLFLLQSNTLAQLRVDVSRGAATYPIPCDSLQECGGTSRGLPRRKWSLGGPLPPSFTYLNEAISMYDVGDDSLEGCACFGDCCEDQDDVDGGSSCPCVQLNAAVER